MITTTSTAASGDRPVGPHGHATEDAGVTGPPAGSAYWIDPGTDQVYPLSYRAYRQTREAEEKTPAMAGMAEQLQAAASEWEILAEETDKKK